MLQQRIGLIGAGQMATALAQGFVKAGLTTPDRLLASDVDQAARERFAGNVGALTTDDNLQVASESDILILAVKPQQMPQVVAGLRGSLRRDAVVVSIAAGIRLASLAQWLGSDVRTVRVMPNTPCLVGQGACASVSANTPARKTGH